MPVQGGLVEETVVLDMHRVDDAVHKQDDQKDAVLPVDASVVLWVVDANHRGHELSEAEIGRGDGDGQTKPVTPACQPAHDGHPVGRREARDPDVEAAGNRVSRADFSEGQADAKGKDRDQDPAPDDGNGSARHHGVAPHGGQARQDRAAAKRNGEVGDGRHGLVHFLLVAKRGQDLLLRGESRNVGGSFFDLVVVAMVIDLVDHCVLFRNSVFTKEKKTICVLTNPKKNKNDDGFCYLFSSASTFAS